MSKIVKLSDRSHVLKRPARYIGSIVPVDVDRFYLSNDKIIFGNITYVPAFLKIAREIIDNSIDAILKTKVGNLVSVKIDNQKVIIEDNSTGIPIKAIHDEHGNQIDKLAPEAVWTELKTGSNFDDNSNDTQIGQNGEGSTLTNIFSIKFIGETDDGNKYFKLECEDNMNPEKIKTKVTGSKGKTGTKVTFWPDLEKLHLGDSIPEIYQDLIKFELLYLAITYPEIDFKFNGKLLKIKSAKQLYNQYFDNVIILEETEDIIIGFSPSDDGYRFIHFINGLNVFNGGKVLDYVEDKIIGALTERAKKKIKDIKKSDVKNKITLHCIIKNLPLPRFSDQIKSESVNQPSQYPEQAKQILEIAKSRFIERVYKNKEIMNPVIDLFKAKQLVEEKKLAKKAKKQKRDLPKYWEPEKEFNYLILTEGDSAVGSIISGVGRYDKGYFPLKGKIINALKTPFNKIIKNEEILNILDILNIDLSKDSSEQDPRYNKVVFATDADVDGHHIKALLLAFFYKYIPQMLIDKKVYLLNTPIIILYKGDNIHKFLFSFDEVKAFEEANDMNKFNYKYTKGLGSLSDLEWEELFKQYSFEDLLEQLVIEDEEDLLTLEKWMNEEKEFRKEMIKENIKNFNEDAI